MSDKTCRVEVLIKNLPHEEGQLEEALSQLECALSGHVWTYTLGIVEDE